VVLTWLFNDAVMGLLAIAALGLALTPAVFDLADDQQRELDRLEWAIVLAFTADYLLHLALAHSKTQFLLNPWRILDLATIVFPLMSLLPAASDSLRHTLALRLLRLLRAFAFGLRATPWLARGKDLLPPVPAVLTPKAQVIQKQQDGWQPRAVPWGEFLASLSRREYPWFDVFDLSPDRVEDLATASGVSKTLLRQVIGSQNSPRLETVSTQQVITTWLTTARYGDRPEIERTGVLLAVLEGKVLLSVAARDCRLWERMAQKISREPTARSFVLEGVLALLGTVLEENEDVLTYLEGYVRAMEEVPVARSGEAFFQLAFRIRKDLSQIRADLWRIAGILKAIHADRIPLPWVPDEEDAFRVMSDEADYLYETADNLREGLLSLIELHMNTVSFQTNRFMKLLAVVSTLGVVPATVAGLLGMNVLGAPWPITLPQVAFFVVLVVLAVLHVLLVSGCLD
jgi:Mg2+ and Co2+ transporter CorA